MSKPTITIASGPVIIENNSVLLVQHGDKNMWKFPGGKIDIESITDWDAALEETCIREAKEELGIAITITHPLKSLLIPRPAHENELVMLIHFLATRTGDITPGADIEGWDWFPLDALPDNCAPNIKPVLNSIPNA